MNKLLELMAKNLAKKAKEDPDGFKELERKAERFADLMTCKDLTKEEEKELAEYTENMKPRDLSAIVNISCTTLSDDDTVITGKEDDAEFLRKSINASILEKIMIK